MNRRLDLGLWQRVALHFPTIACIVLGLVFLIISYFQPTENVSPATMSPISLIVTALGLFGLSAIFYFWLDKKLIFEPIEISFDKLTALEVIIETAKKDDWTAMTSLTLEAKRLEFTKTNLFGTSNDIVLELEDNKVLISARGNYPTDEKIIDKLRTALKMKGYEIEHQKKNRV